MSQTAEAMQAPVQITVSKLALAEHQRNVYVLNAPGDVEPDDCLRPEFWAHVAEKLRPWDKVEVRRDDREWFAEFMVIDADRTWARVTMLGLWPLSRDVSMETQTGEALREAFDNFLITNRGSRQWSVVRKADSEVMYENGATRDDAENWLSRYARQHMAAPTVVESSELAAYEASKQPVATGGDV